jgi:putative isomerase
MTRRGTLALALVLLLAAGESVSQPTGRVIRTAEYRVLQQRLAGGWNTWYNNNVMSSVLLPEGFAVNLSLAEGNVEVQRNYFKVSRAAQRKEEVILGLRADDGSYTSLTCTLGKTSVFIESATEGEDLFIRVTPVKRDTPPAHLLVVEPSILWNLPGSLGVVDGRLTGQFARRMIELSSAESPVDAPYVPVPSAHLAFSLQRPVHLQTGSPRSAAGIDALFVRRKKEQEDRVAKYGDLGESFKAMQTILAWNAIYDPANCRVISPVSRWWSANWGGYVLFDWDTYFASLMYSLFNKDLAYANAIEITKSITPGGFIPNYSAPGGVVSWDRSQPPIGGLVILEIYKRYRETWFLREVYDELLSWNRWWPHHRDAGGYLAWGSDAVPDSLHTIDKHNAQAAMYESGLDNSPMYDGIPFNAVRNTMELADVGLMSFYVADCKAIGEIADILGHKADAAEFRERGERYEKKLKGLWDEESGMFLNRRLDTGEKSPRLSPTNFYPMLAGACTNEQAGRMMREHYFNRSEFHGTYVMPSIARNDPGFKDNSYWRGRVWAPMNFLVYLGMRNYDVAEARADLVARSGALLMKSWKENGSIYENYNSVTGQGDDVPNADSFYHWGALLTFMAFLERGY